jgi:hypothetical protein
VPQHGSRCKGIAEFDSSGRGADAGAAFPRTRATSLCINHDSPWLTHLSIRCCKFTRLTLPSGSSWPSLLRVFSGRNSIAFPKNQAGRSPLKDLLLVLAARLVTVQ